MTETRFRQHIKQLAQTYQQEQKRAFAKAKHREDINLQTTNKVAEVLEQFGSEILQSDVHLTPNEFSEGSLGLVIFYEKTTNLICPSFSVSATCQLDTVNMYVSDGRWKQVRGVLGLWADWTNQRQIYSGTPDPSAIRKSLESAFLTWYEAVLKGFDG